MTSENGAENNQQEQSNLDELKNALATESPAEELTKSQKSEDGAVEDFTEKVENEQFQKDDEEFKATQEQPVYANPEAYGVIENSNGQPVPQRWIPQPHEQRVVDEYTELSDRTKKLFDFVNFNPAFLTLSTAQQLLMKKQLFHMQQYSSILNERLYLFQGAEPAALSVGEETIGFFGTEKEAVFDLKYISMMMIDFTNFHGNDQRLNAVVRTDMEKTQMVAVKSVHNKK